MDYSNTNHVAVLVIRWHVAVVVFHTTVCILAQSHHGHTFVRTGCVYTNSEGTNFYQQSLQNCKNKCLIRPWCKAINYFRREQKCSLRRRDNGTDLDSSNHSCVYISRDVMESIKHHSCEKDEDCNKKENQISKNDCRPFGNLRNAETLGNMQLEGSRLRIKCNNYSRETTGRDRTECTSTGTWSHYPQCIIVTPTLGHACVDSSDCVETESICIYDECFCSPMYRYNISQKNCVKVCTVITDEFTKYNGMAIYYYNFAKDYNTNTHQCRRRCLENPKCMSYESYGYKFTACNLAYVSKEMITNTHPDAYRPDGNTLLFSRICE